MRIETDRLGVPGAAKFQEVRVKVLTEDLEPTTEAKVHAGNHRRGRQAPSSRHRLPALRRSSGIYERKLELGGVGRYEIEAVAKLNKDELGTDKSILQVRPATAELRQTGQNVALLKMLATQSGGKYLPLEKANELPASLHEATHTVIKHRDNDLWDNPWIFALIVTLLCAEWLLRKRNGLP